MVGGCSRQSVLHQARAVDDPRNAGGEDVESGGDSRKQEYWRDRRLDDWGNAGYMQKSIHGRTLHEPCNPWQAGRIQSTMSDRTNSTGTEDLR